MQVIIGIIVGVIIILLSFSDFVVKIVRKVFGSLIQMFSFGNSVLFEVFPDEKSREFFAKLGIIIVGVTCVLISVLLKLTEKVVS